MSTHAPSPEGNLLAGQTSAARTHRGWPREHAAGDGHRLQEKSEKALGL